MRSSQAFYGSPPSLQVIHLIWVAQSTVPVQCLAVVLLQVLSCPPPPLGLVLGPWRPASPSPWANRPARWCRSGDPAAVLLTRTAHAGPPRSTRTSCTSCALRSWPTRSWHVGSLYRTTCRWRCRANSPCQACSSSPCPPSPRAPVQPRALGPWAPGSAEGTVGGAVGTKHRVQENVTARLRQQYTYSIDLLLGDMSVSNVHHSKWVVSRVV